MIAAAIMLTRRVRISVQHRPSGAGDLGWTTREQAEIVVVALDQQDWRATWSGAIDIPDAHTSDDHEHSRPPMRRPGVTQSAWRILVEEVEILDADHPESPDDPNENLGTVERVVYVETVTL